MKKLMLVLIIALMPSLVLGQEAKTNTDVVLSEMTLLNEAQKAELAASAVAIRRGESTAATAQTWIDIGSNLGKGLSATAREMGVAVNDFAQTPVGKVAFALIVWKVMGTDIVHIMVSLFGIAGLCLWYTMFKRSYGKFSEDGTFLKLELKRSQHGEGSSEAWAFLMMFVFPFGLMLMVVFSLLTI